MQERSFLVQVLLDMATGGGAKLEPLIVDKAGIFDAGINKGYNPVTVASGDTSVSAEKGAVANHAVVITPEATVSAGWQDGKSVTGEGIGVSASELVSGTYSVSQAGNADVTNYQSVNVKSGGTTASVERTTVGEHTVRFTPKATVTQGWQDSGIISGESVDVNADDLVSGTYPVTSSGEFDVSAYEKISVPSGVVAASATKGIVAGHTVTVTPKASRTAGFISSGETEGLGVNVTASELVSGTLNVSQSGNQDVTNYESISVPSGRHSASATRHAMQNNSIRITPHSTTVQGFVSSGTVDGADIIVNASDVTDGTFTPTSNGIFDVSSYKYINVEGIMTKTLFYSKDLTGVVVGDSSYILIDTINHDFPFNSIGVLAELELSAGPEIAVFIGGFSDLSTIVNNRVNSPWFTIRDSGTSPILYKQFCLVSGENSSRGVSFVTGSATRFWGNSTPLYIKNFLSSQYTFPTCILRFYDVYM